jgi:cytochrome P450
MHLGRNPRVLEKIRQEIGPEDLDDVITLRDIERYKYVNDVVKEVLRVTPPVGAGYRKVLKSFEIEVGVAIWPSENNYLSL